MKYRSKLVFIILFVYSITGCNTGDDSNTGSSDVTKKVTIDTEQTFQTIDGFAASDCWTANYIGNYWSSSQKESIARLLFSQEIKNGSPEGIGLSMWRFNLGAGTAEQGDDSGIEDKPRRAECFLSSDGSYNWQKQLGQQYFLEKALEYGCESFVIFCNSPPVYYTYNGKGFSARGSRSNLKDEHYKSFADYMATVISHFKSDRGINFSYISPVNEPQYNWESGQEGSGWQNNEIKHLVVELDKSLTEKNLDTKILITEAGDWEYLYKSKDDTGRSNQIEAFFSSGSGNYIGNLTHVPALIGGHSYWTDGNWNTMQQVRTQVKSKASAYGLKVYQTEWSMIGDYINDNDYPGHEAATYHDIALYMAKVIHQDLTTANVSSWSYWTCMDVPRWGHKNRFLLIELTPAGGVYGDMSESGSHKATKTLWVLGNYSRFIRPGYKRVDLSIENPSDSFFGSAWLSPDQYRLVVVYTNMTSKSIKANINLKGLNRKSISLKRYVTSTTKDLKEDVIVDNQCIVEAQSVTTFIYQF
ncbi:MAG: beta-glycosidase [Tannerellaceae bacterium]|jgi:O-glycosyl hydrolase|nr:beta-glycosidase [Tannerellaceae bacterium]